MVVCSQREEEIFTAKLWHLMTAIKDHFMVVLQDI